MSHSRNGARVMKPWNEKLPFWKFSFWISHGPKDVRQAITRRRRHQNRILLHTGAEAQSELEPERRDAPREWW